jgi:hypothetical protein
MSLKSPEAVLRTALVGSTSFTALVSSRVYPVLAPATSSLPFVVWRRSGITREQTLGLPMGVPKVTVEYEIYGATYESARTVADTMRSILDGYGGTVNNTEVKQVSLENESDGFALLQGDQAPPAYSVTQQYDILWQES